MSDSSLDTLQLETPRLILRVPRLADLDAFAALMADQENATLHRRRGPARGDVAWADDDDWRVARDRGVDVLRLRKSDGPLGRTARTVACREGWPGAEVGWAIVRDCWGRGYATEGAEAAMDFAVDRLGWTDIIHSIAPDNAASQQVARKLGSQNRGPGRLPPPFTDVPVDIWGQTREEWRARQRA